MATAVRQRGVSLIEACVVLAISSIVVGSAIPGMRGLLETRRLNAAAQELATDIQFVRTEAVARNRALRLSVQAAPVGTCYVVHTGSAAQCACAASGPATCSGSAEQIKTVNFRPTDRVLLQANVSSVLFDPLHGTTTPTGTVRLSGSDGREIHHVINIMGRVRSCSPQGAMPGYRTC